MKQAKFILLIILLISCYNILAQSKKEFSKQLTIFTAENYNKHTPLRFEPKNPKKHGFDKFTDGFSKYFKQSGFKIIESTAEINTSQENMYKIVVDYDYGYKISAYKMQYSDLKMDIVDVQTNKSVGNIQFDDRFNIGETAEVIAKSLQAKPEPNPNINSALLKKSKEERLTELKNLFDKKLITEQDYEAQKKKILDE